MHKSILIPILAITTLTSPAAPLQFQSGTRQVPLVELYTSEGCSSCPPAEEWISRLASTPDLWTSFVPVAFHVDYWNQLGWKDQWSSPDYSQRQRDYSQLWKSDYIYTPCFALNGAEWQTWRLHRRPSDSGNDQAGVLSIGSTDTNIWSVVFEPADNSTGPFEIHAALLAGDLDSSVNAGENRGRTLHHEFAALDLIQIGLTTRNHVARGKFLFSPAHHPEVKRLAIAAWVTHAGEMKPLQSTGGWLIAPPVAANK